MKNDEKCALASAALPVGNISMLLAVARLYLRDIGENLAAPSMRREYERRPIRVATSEIIIRNVFLSARHGSGMLSPKACM